MQRLLYFLLGIITFLCNVTHAKKCVVVRYQNETIHQPEPSFSDSKDQFYIIIVENPQTYNTTTSENSKIKRELNDMFVEGFVDEIHSLIIGNKDTYENPEKLDELDDEAAQMKKRDNQETYALDYGDSNYVYKLSSTENKTAIYAYLSETLSETIDNMPNVISCEPDSPVEYTLDYNKNDILKETGWKGLATKSDARLHLSLLSQGKFDEKLVHQYDDTYYYPSSGGKGIDIVILDNGFNFDYFEFENTDRKAECKYYIKDAKAKNTSNKKYCYNTKPKNHGTNVADAAAGKTSGVAPNANVYGVLVDISDGNKKGTHAHIITALETIKSKLIRPYKTILSISVGYKWYDNSPKQEIEQSKYILELLDEISKKAVIIASAGNNNEQLTYKSNTHKMYCNTKSVICVGGIDNYVNQLKTMATQNYRKSKNSNYGECVDIYAPYTVRTYCNNNESVTTVEVQSGTSLSAPIVSGVAATIMSEQTNTKFNTESMLKYLKKIGIKNAIKDLTSDSNNLFINNGKHVVYSKDNVYYGCGVNAGNTKCGKNQCCSKYGYCGTTSDYCKAGCQSSFGKCS